jgi:hypothetical protein
LSIRRWQPVKKFGSKSKGPNQFARLWEKDPEDFVTPIMRNAVGLTQGLVP